MLEMKPGEDPIDLSRRRDLWLECHGSKLTMWMLGGEYDSAKRERRHKHRHTEKGEGSCQAQKRELSVREAQRVESAGVGGQY